MQFGERLAEAVKASVPCCVGIDPHLDRIPDGLDLTEWAFGVIDAVAGVVPAVKPQSAFFEQLGPVGVETLGMVIDYAKRSGLIVILDAKRGDIGSTAKAYVGATISENGPMKADSVTLSPYLGAESLQPYKDYCNLVPGKGAWVLVRTSNPGAIQWQGGPVHGSFANGVSGWLNDANIGHDLGPFGAVVGATLDPDELRLWRRQLPNTWFLLPGYGAQGASAKDCLAGFREDKTGGLVVAARSVLFGKGDTFGNWEENIRKRAKAFAEDVGSVV